MNSRLSHSIATIIFLLVCNQFSYADQRGANRFSSDGVRKRLVLMIDNKVKIRRFSQVLLIFRKNITLQDLKLVYVHTINSSQKPYKEALLKNVYEKIKDIITSDKVTNLLDNHLSYFSRKLTGKQYHELFIISIQSGNTQYVTSFIKYGGQVNKKSEYSNSPLDEAILKKKLEVAKLLYAHGGRSLLRNRYIYDVFLNSILHNELKFVNFLIQIGVDVNRSNGDGVTPLIGAITNGNISLIKKLLKKGAKLERWSAGPRGLIVVNPTRMAVIMENTEVLKILLGFGAKLDQMPKSKSLRYRSPTELLIAIYKKNLKQIKYLLEQGASVRLASYTLKRETVFQYLAENGKIEILNVILAACEDIITWKKLHSSRAYECKVSRNGIDLLWALRYAVKNKQQIIIDRLIDYGILNISVYGNRDILKIAVLANNTRLIKRLEKMNVKLPIDSQHRLLYEAAKQGNLVQVKRILSSRVDPKNQYTLHVLHTAILRDHIDIAKLLYNAGFRDGGYNALHMAVVTNDINELKRQLGSGIDINSKTKNGKTAIYFAAENNLTDIAITLLKYKPDVNIKIFGGTPLSRALQNKNSLLVKHLLSAGANPNIFWDQRIPLELAILQGNKEMFDILLKYGAKPDVKNIDGKTPLMVSVDKKRAQFAIRLLSIKQDINTADKNGRTILHYAAKSNDPELTKLVLIKKPGLNIQDKKGLTPLHLAVKKRRLNIVQLFLAKKARLDIRDEKGNTALALAFSGRRHNKLIKLLINSGSNVNDISSKYITDLLNDRYTDNIDITKLVLTKLTNVKLLDHNKYSLVTLAVLRKKNNVLDLLKILVKKGADINYAPSGDHNIGFNFTYKDKTTIPIIQFLVRHGLNLKSKGYRGQSLLSEAVYRNNLELLSFYLKKGLSIEDRDKEGRTPLLYLVARSGYKKKGTLEYLLLKGANIKVKDKHGTPLLSLAIKRLNLDHIENLIRAGANINERDNNGKTPLMYAVSRAVHMKIINYLITKGADVKAKDNNKKSVLEYCRYNECRDIIKTALKGH